MRKIPNVNTHIFKQPDIPWSVAGFSADAQNVINRMSALTAGQDAVIATFVDALVSSGNYPLIDELYCLKLNSTDWLTGFKSKTASAQAEASFSANGAIFNGLSTSYLDLGWNPATDGPNWKLNDCGATMYVHTWTDADNGAIPMGLRIGSDRIEIKKNAAGSGYFNSVNSPTDQEASAIVPYGSDKVITSSRQNSATLMTSHVDGANAVTEIENSVAIPSGTMYLGGMNLGGSPINQWEGIIGLVAFHAGLAFDEASFNTDVRTFLAAI